MVAKCGGNQRECIVVCGRRFFVAGVLCRAGRGVFFLKILTVFCKVSLMLVQGVIVIMQLNQLNKQLPLLTRVPSPIHHRAPHEGRILKRCGLRPQQERNPPLFFALGGVAAAALPHAASPRGAVFPPPAFGAEADKVRHRQQQKKTFLISRRRRGFSDGLMLGKMTTKRPYTEEQVAAWARAKRLARARWCRGRRRDCYGEFRGEAPAVPFSFPTLPAFYAAPQAAAGGRTSLPSPSPRPAHTPRRVVGS